MNNAVLVRGFCMEFLYINRAIFAIAVVNGTSMPFFSNLIAKFKQ